ncbi:hypothetical protein CROQUDRAFT_103913 [Cronartium quercuum f. sp. fusiforme G11]|uniref:Uncharacterized protein n=1 Tax=Cronartium quercuum f. sp. fusiforme G11 TaxID=708437 RepID=A0A9P6NVD3_9BASI|nr:hypothetical protein CROQUDRAFT_103913 [Cronartium quercuum f. sp. fusiforme G11]
MVRPWPANLSEEPVTTFVESTVPKHTDLGRSNSPQPLFETDGRHAVNEYTGKPQRLTKAWAIKPTRASDPASPQTHDQGMQPHMINVLYISRDRGPVSPAETKSLINMINK